MWDVCWGAKSRPEVECERSRAVRRFEAQFLRFERRATPAQPRSEIQVSSNREKRSGQTNQPEDDIQWLSFDAENAEGVTRSTSAR